MNRLVHERAPAVEPPGAPPVAGVVVALRAVPLDVSVSLKEATKFARLERLFKPDVRVRKTAHENRGEFDPGGVGGVYDFLGTFDGDLERLLDHHVATGPGSGDRGLQVSAAGRADGHDFDLFILKKAVHIGIELYPMLFGDLSGLIKRTAGDAD